MEQFKLKSIDELDLEFVNKANEQSKSDISSTSDSLIPEISKNTPENPAEESPIKFFNNPATAIEFENEPEFNPAPQDNGEAAPRPLVPIGQNSATYSPVGAPEEPISEDDFADYENKEAPQKAKKGGAALAGKIISIVMLAATIVVFILGCFVTIFLDNNGSDIAGYCFNTMSSDIYDTNGETMVSKGDLIISKKAEASEYVSGKMIAVPSIVGEDRCDIHVISHTNSVIGDSAELVTTDITSSTSYSSTVMSASSYGIVSSYIPVLGGLLHFAMENAILVCVLFILLAALWCLILVLIENKKPKTKKN